MGARDVETNVQARPVAVRLRDPTTIGRIERRRDVLGSAPVIAGTRITVSAVRNFHEAGYSVDAIIEEYPTLTPADVEAALSYDDTAAA